MSTPPRDFNHTRRPSPEDVKRCYDAGLSRNKTAQELRVSTRQVDRVAAEIGLSWSAEATAEAVAVRKKQAEAERLDLADAWRELAVDTVARALAETEDAAERRRHVMSAEMATNTELTLWDSFDKHAGHGLAAVAIAVSDAFKTLDSVPLEDLEGAEDDGEEPP